MKKWGSNTLFHCLKIKIYFNGILWTSNFHDFLYYSKFMDMVLGPRQTKLRLSVSLFCWALQFHSSGAFCKWEVLTCNCKLIKLSWLSLTLTREGWNGMVKVTMLSPLATIGLSLCFLVELGFCGRMTWLCLCCGT